MSRSRERRAASSRGRSVSSHTRHRRSRRQSATRDDGKGSSSEDKGSVGSWNVDRGRSRTRRPSNPVSEDNLRRRGYHTLFSQFGKVFHVEKRWKMIRDMGSGAYGVVISAADEISGETVAIKLVTRVFEKVSLAKRALREITLLRHFANHENITGLIDVDAITKDFNEIYLFMEPMEADLHQIIKSGQTLTNEHVQYFVYQILRGMKYIHSASVVHRDLKPGNLLVNADCELKICDFGLSRGFDSAPDENATNMTEYVATRWYRAPEIMLAFRRYDTAIDVWSIGCILAELIMGKPLFKGKDYVDQLNKILDVLGTPDESVISKIKSDKAQAYVRSLPFQKGVPFRKLMPSADPQALDLLAKMLTFDPHQRISVTEALKHPWLSSYHDVNDEPECSTPYNKWRDIERLETIDEFREALWKEIEEYRREVRSAVFDWSLTFSDHIISPDERTGRIVSPVQARPSTPPPGGVCDTQITEADSSTAVEETAVEKDAAVVIVNEKDTAVSDTATVVPSALESPIAVPGFRSSLERRDSVRTSTPANMENDPVVTYARRSSILQAARTSGASVSPVRHTAGMPSYTDEHGSLNAYHNNLASQIRESMPVSSTPPPIVRAPSVCAGPSGTVGAGTIPFPTANTGSYIVPARSRTASTYGGEYGTAHRKLLRTLSTVSIHESIEGIAGGLAAMGPIGQAIIERRETAADAPPSEMPREFGPVKEEESEYRTTSGRWTGSASSSTSSDREQGQDEHKRNTHAKEGEGKESTGSAPTKKEKRFLLF